MQALYRYFENTCQGLSECKIKVFNYDQITLTDEEPRCKPEPGVTYYLQIVHLDIPCRLHKSTRPQVIVAESDVEVITTILPKSKQHIGHEKTTMHCSNTKPVRLESFPTYPLL